MDHFSRRIFIVVGLLHGVLQGSFASANNNSDEDLKTVITSLDQKVNLLENQINILQKVNDEQQEEIYTLKKENYNHQEQTTSMEVDVKSCKQMFMSSVKRQTQDMMTMSETLDLLTLETNEHKTSINVLRDTPIIYYCGYRKAWSSHSTIEYSSLFYSRSNQPTGGLDITTGVFTSPFPGTYRVTWSLFAENYAGEYRLQGIVSVYLILVGNSAEIYLYKNSERIDESLYWYNSAVYEDSFVRDQGGRTLVSKHKYCEYIH